MKVTIKNENKSTEIKYPCLMIDKNGDEVVMFSKEGVGMILNGRGAGNYVADWHMDLFNTFTGTIELSND